MNTSPQVHEAVEYQAHDAQDRSQTTPTKRNVEKGAVAELYAKYMHAVMSHPKFERRRKR